MQFTAKINKGSTIIEGAGKFLSLEQIDNYSYEATATIDYILDFETRDWGIKSIYVTFQKVTAEIKVNVWDEGSGIDKEINFDSTAEQFKDFKIVNEAKFEDNSFWIEGLEIDFNNKKLITS